MTQHLEASIHNEASRILWMSAIPPHVFLFPSSQALFGLELAALQPPPLGSRDCDMQLSVCLHWGKVGNALCAKRAENPSSLLRSPSWWETENSGHLQSTRMHTSLLVAVLPVSAFIIHILHKRNQNSLG